jgi:flagellar basal body rod protein FlgF
MPSRPDRVATRGAAVMPIYSAFAPSTLGLQSQAQSLGTISQNIANATAGGYKRTETRFQTVLSETLRQHSDLGGALPIDVQMIDRQGIIMTTARDLDLAIIGDGFFVVSTAVTGGERFYTRDGSFEMRLETRHRRRRHHPARLPSRQERLLPDGLGARRHHRGLPDLGRGAGAARRR